MGIPIHFFSRLIVLFSGLKKEPRHKFVKEEEKKTGAGNHQQLGYQQKGVACRGKA